MRGDSDMFFPQAKILIDKVASGKNVVVVPHIVILETIHTLRRKIAENSKFRGSKTEHYAHVKSETFRITQNFIKTIREFAKKRQVLLIKPNTSVSVHHAMVLSKLQNYFGYIRTISICPHCKKRWVKKIQKTYVQCVITAQIQSKNMITGG